MLPFLIQTVRKALGQNILSPWAAPNKLSFHRRARQILPSLLSPSPPLPSSPSYLTALLLTCSGALGSSAPCGLGELARSLYLSINCRETRGTAQLARGLCKRLLEKKRRLRMQLGVQQRWKEVKREIFVHYPALLSSLHCFSSPCCHDTTPLPLCNCAISATAWFSYITNG